MSHLSGRNELAEGITGAANKRHAAKVQRLEDLAENIRAEEEVRAEKECMSGSGNHRHRILTTSEIELLETCRMVSKRFRSKHGLHVGYVTCNMGIVLEWSLYPPHPEYQAPGCFLFGATGALIATSANGLFPAERWEQVAAPLSKNGQVQSASSRKKGRCERSFRAAEQYRRARKLPGGYVICFDGKATGWRRNLSETGGWVPGCFAFDADGNGWEAVGGNDHCGAERWEQLL